MILEVQADYKGRFEIPPVVEALVQGAFGQLVYKVSEDLLREAVSRTPIDTGTLRGSGSVSLDGMPLIQYGRKSRTSKKTGKTSSITAPTMKVGIKTVAQYCGKLSISGTHTFTFSVGFNTPYACVIHEGVYRLGRRSVRANARHNKYPVWQHGTGQFGKIGPKFLTRAWQDNEAKYINYIKTLGGDGNITVK